MSLPTPMPAMTPPLLADVRRDFGARTWIVALMSPVIAVAVTFLVTLFFAWLGLRGMGDLDMGGVNLGDVITAPKWAALTLLLALGGTARVVAEPNLVDMSFFVPALTLTLLIGLIIYFLNQWVGRGKRNSTLLVWVSAGVLAAIGAGLAAFMRVDLSPGGAVMGQPIPPLALQASPLFTALTCLPLGLFAAGFGRMTTVKSTPRNRFTLTAASSIPTYAHAVRLAFTAFILVSCISALAFGIDLMVRQDAKIAWLLLAFPFFLTTGVMTMFGAVGASFAAEYDATGLGMGVNAQGDTTFLLWDNLATAPAIVALISMVLVLVWTAYRWGRSRDPRMEFGAIAWTVMPFGFGATTAVIWGITRGSAKMAAQGMDLASASYDLHWYLIFIGIGLGLVVEAFSRPFRTRPPETMATGYLTPHASDIPHHPSVPGAPGGMPLHPEYPGTPVAPAPQQPQPPVQPPMQAQPPHAPAPRPEDLA